MNRLTMEVRTLVGLAVIAGVFTWEAPAQAHPPQVSCEVDQMLWPPNHDLVDVGLRVTAFDPDGGGVDVTVSVYSDEDDVEQTGGGRFSPDAKPGSSFPFDESVPLRLRSERKGNGDGRVYLLVIEAIDDQGQRSSTCCTVVVPHDQGAQSIADVEEQAAVAEAACEAGLLPEDFGFVPVGDGPIIGPKQ